MFDFFFSIIRLVSMKFEPYHTFYRFNVYLKPKPNVFPPNPKCSKNCKNRLSLKKLNLTVIDQLPTSALNH